MARQALVLINRRGYSWSVLCRSCGASVQCVELQHLDDASQYTRQPAGMPLLRFDPADTEAVSESASRNMFISLEKGSSILEERLRKEFRRRANRAAGPGYGADEAQYQETLGAFAGGRWTFWLGRKWLAKDTIFNA